MSISLSQLSDKQRQLIAPKDRDILGKEAETFADAQKRGEARSERELQGQIVNLLRLKGIEVLWHRTDKKSHATVGWPDLTLAVCGSDEWAKPRVFACAWEVKLPGKHLDEAQRNMRKAMTSSPNNWTHRVITSVDMVRKELKAMGLD